MNLYLCRDYQDEVCTIGRLFNPLNNFEVHTIERPWKDNKRGVSCIPEGIYIAERDYFHKGDYEAFELRNVPDRSEIKIHIANYPHQIQGCIAPGIRRDIESSAVWSSTAAFNKFMNEVENVDRIKIHIFNVEHLEE